MIYGRKIHLMWGQIQWPCRLFIYMSDNFNAILEISTLLFFLLQVFRHTLKKEHFSTVKLYN